MGDQPIVFFHVGLQRTGTTFLQRKVFPKVDGVRYIPKKKYKQAKQIIAAENHANYLVSHEFNRGFATEIEAFGQSLNAEVYPIIVLRNHADWLLSQYKRHLKNGILMPIKAFYPLEGSAGYLNADALDYYPKIILLEKTFGRKPLVLLYDDLLNDPKQFISEVATYVGTTVDLSSVDVRPLHTSYSWRALHFLYYVLGENKEENIKTNRLIRYPLLTLGQWLPTPKNISGSLIPADYLAAVNKRYTDDWQRCQRYRDHSA
ncbi:MAG: hypothetical protein ACI8QD_002786 [Cyclobacteriaceae bacterium]|jgi:hypothetical protein